MMEEGVSQLSEQGSVGGRSNDLSLFFVVKHKLQRMREPENPDPIEATISIL